MYVASLANKVHSFLKKERNILNNVTEVYWEFLFIFQVLQGDDKGYHLILKNHTVFKYNFYFDRYFKILYLNWRHEFFFTWW